MKNLSKSAIAAFGVTALLLTACGDDADTTSTDAPSDVESEAMADASVSFENVVDGDTITSPFEATFTATGVTIVAAGEPVDGEGHMHIMVDTPCVTVGEVIVKDESHLHFGDGATTGTLELEAGEHTLCLQFADGLHVASALTQEITVTVA
ncbi:MAG: hypothetical protein ACI867_001047 [Glaciecola sp.]|jgi:hypothetical protein